MSFDLILQTSHLSDKTEKATNPFTGEVYDKPVGETLTDEERRSVAAILTQCGGEEDEFGCRVLDIGDGSSIEAYFEGLLGEEDFECGMLALRSISPPVAKLLFDIMHHGSLVLQAPIAEPMVLATSQEICSSVRARWPEVEPVADPHQLYKKLKPGFSEWASYRDRALESDF